MTPARRLLPWLLLATLGLGAVGCGAGSEAPGAEEAPHAHNGLPAGDGTRSSYVGYSLQDVRLPAESGTPGVVSFHVENFRGAPVTDFLVELTKKMHVYVVSTDLAVFRHLHPTMAADGTWSGNITLPRDGRYRLVAEFVAEDDGGNGDTLILGTERTVGTPGRAEPLPAPTTETSDDGVTVRVLQAPRVGYENEMSLGISKGSQPASLGTYLGVHAHVSAFHAETGRLVHMHPLGAPTTEDGRAVLRFHTGFELPGTYRMFVQSRLSGVVRTIPMTIEVTGTPAPEL